MLSGTYPDSSDALVRPWQTDTPMRACPHWSPESPVSHPKTTVRAGLIPVTLGPSLLKSLSVGNFRETRQKGFFFPLGGAMRLICSPYTLQATTVQATICAAQELCSLRFLTGPSGTSAAVIHSKFEAFKAGTVLQGNQCG